MDDSDGDNYESQQDPEEIIEATGSYYLSIDVFMDEHIEREDINKLMEKMVKLNASSSEADWRECLEILVKDRYKYYLCNTKPGKGDYLFPSSLWSFQHHVAYYNAPITIVKEMLQHKFPVSLKDREDMTPYDHVKGSMTDDYRNLFKPVLKYPLVNMKRLKDIERGFHALVHLTHEDNLKKEYLHDSLILPELVTYLELMDEKVNYVHLEIPRMRGGVGVIFELDSEGKDVLSLHVDTSSRTCGGSGKRYRITEHENILLKENIAWC